MKNSLYNRRNSSKLELTKTQKQRTNMATKKALPTADLAKQLYSKLTAGRKAEPKKLVAKRPAITLTSQEELTFRRFTAAYAVAKEVDARRDNEKALFNFSCLLKWIEDLWMAKNRPPTQFVAANNLDGTPDMSANFIVSDKYTFNIPEVKESETLDEAFTRKFVELFVATGMDKDDAEAAAVSLVNNELDVAQRPNIDLFRWLVGHYEGEGENKAFKDATNEEKVLGVKILTNLQCQQSNKFVPLTQEEYDQIIEMRNNIDVKKGFLQRVCSYVKTLDQLKAIFTVIRPIVWPGQTKFGISDTPKRRNERMWFEAKDILGVE
jgi:hypothetical protein